MGLTPEQQEYLLKPLRSARVAKRSQGGKQLSYLEAWDVKAHLIRIFGFGNFDSEVTGSNWIETRQYESNSKSPMIEVAYKATVKLTIRDLTGQQICTYTEAAVGSASGPPNLSADLHDNALKTAASDALKRCAINLGTQFGLSLYDNGATADVVRGGPGVGTIPTPSEGMTDEQKARIAESLGATEIEPA